MADSAMDFTNKEVVEKITHSFASVRASLTEQRSQSNSVGQQVAAAVAKMDAVAVSLERLAAMRGQQADVIISIRMQLDTLIAQHTLAASREEATAAADAERADGEDAWLSMARVRVSF